ncbi:FHA domain-containing protein [Mucilaginibacter psychrotolerans]|uniref:FHA domain-containing protein n=1 Tax=Mucilaginibacter psychrotolerans TaxID=1524096 RepID=A0A4Y8SLR8_9SPHI|nr:FHA domain-containing protein [Mucilaginibacter psychrotolerans]TFF39306.1 FHA domain-containing protein [Mucilaginibacter psychrotolerans]
MIFNLFNSDAKGRPDDVKGVRHALLQFIKQELQKAEGGEGSHIKGLSLFLNCSTTDRHMYEAAVYAEQPELFKDEVQRIADDFDLGLPERWTLDVVFDAAVPDEAALLPNLDAAFFIKTNKHFIKQTATAYLRVLNGETEEKEYTLASGSEKLNIGRDKKAQGDDGFFRTNHIAFPSESSDAANKYVSRQHAHIGWNVESQRFVLYADEGGVPPRNKVKIRSEKSENVIKLHSTTIGHPLEEGDQVILGESAVLEFSYQPLNK